MIMTPIFKLNEVFYEPWNKVYEKEAIEDAAFLPKCHQSEMIRANGGMQFSNDQLTYSYKKTLLCCRCPTKIEHNLVQHTAASWYGNTGDI